MKVHGNRTRQIKLVREMRGGEPYEYYPLGRYIVAAPGVCGGRPTFKGTRIEAAYVLDLITAGWSIKDVTDKYRASRISAAAVREALGLAKATFVNSLSATRKAA